jgi:esterase/lipase
LNKEQKNEIKGIIILVHGLTSSRVEMQGLAEYLKNSHYKAIVLELAGHDGNLRTLKTTTAATWISDVTDAFVRAHNEFKNVPIILVGVSFGALLCMHVAAHYQRDVSGIVLLSPSMKLRSKNQELCLSLLSYMPDFILNYLGTVKKKLRKADALAIKDNRLTVHSLGASARLFQIRRKVTKVMKNIICPVLLVQDPNDHLLQNDVIEMVRDGVSSARCDLHYLPGGEHELTLGHRHNEVYALVLNFLETLFR